MPPRWKVYALLEQKKVLWTLPGQASHKGLSWSSRGSPWHFDNFFPKRYTLISHFLFKFGQWSYHGPWFQLWQYQLDVTSGLQVIASDNLVRSAWRGAFGVKIEIFNQWISQNKLTMWLNWQWIREFNYHIYFVTLNDLKILFSFISCDPRYTSDFCFLPLKTLQYELPFKAKNKKRRVFPLFFYLA